MTIEIKCKNEFKTIKTAMILDEVDCVELTFSDGSHLVCATDHLLITDTETKEAVTAKESLNQFIISAHSLEESEKYVKVIKVEDVGKKTCYDLGVDGEMYNTNEILSHNSTTSLAFLLHYILFNFGKNVVILANKAMVAKEILHRLKVAYVNLPPFLQQGIVEWNKSSILLENGSGIIAASSSSSSVRGMSISCVDIENTYVYMRNKNTAKVTTNPIADYIQTNQNLEPGYYQNYYYQVMTSEGFNDFDGFIISEKPTIEIKFKLSNNKNQYTFIRCTEDHLLKNYTLGRFVRADQLQVEDRLCTTLNNVYAEVVEIIKDLSVIKVVDLVNVDSINSYITNEVISHNCLFLDECCGENEKVTIFDKLTQTEEEITLKELYNRVEKENNVDSLSINN